MFKSHQICVESDQNLVCFKCDKKFSFNFQRDKHLLDDHQIMLEKKELSFQTIEGKLLIPKLMN
jgi:hypothetical protein